MGKETLRSELIKFTSTLINGYTGESTILELLGTNDCIDDYVDNQLRERWQLTMPDVKVSCNDKYIDEAALKAYPPLMINGEEYWDKRYDAHTEHREAFIKGVKFILNSGNLKFIDMQIGNKNDKKSLDWEKEKASLLKILNGAIVKGENTCLNTNCFLLEGGICPSPGINTCKRRQVE